MRVRINDNWQFALIGAESPVDYDVITASVSSRSGVLLPHDWLIYDCSDLYRDGMGIYTRILELTEEKSGHYFLIFDGVYMDYTVFINGSQAGEWKYGYSQYVLEITDHIREGSNEILVAVRHKSPNTRWYSGAGIYRDVWFINTPDIYIPENGIYLHTSEEGDGFDVSCDIETAGYTDFAPSDGYPALEVVLSTEAGPVTLEEVNKSKAGEEKYVHSFRGYIKAPHRWDIDDPYLYELKVTLSVGEAVQSLRISVGFKSVRLDTEKGFFLNGRHIKLNGVCEHHDLGLLGAEFNKSAMRRKFEILKGMGVNAIRGTHNMMAPGFVELCDEMGLLYVSEAFDMWEHSKTEYDYARFFPKWHSLDVESWIRRDRNHVSVILWSIGNEISDIHTDPVRGPMITRELLELVRKHDYMGNASVTQGSNYMPWENAQKCADILGVAGYNYAEKYYEEHHRLHPDRVIYGSETSSIAQSRGIYHFPLSRTTLGDEDMQCSALGNNPTSWGARSFEECAGIDRDTPFSLGQFLWSGFDYIGEPTPYHTRSSYLGQIDTAGFPKDAYYFWKSVWSDPAEEPFVYVFPYWDHNPGQTVDVRVVSNLDEVELFLNGESLGRQTLDHSPHSGFHMIADYRVSFTPGVLEACGYVKDSDMPLTRHRRVTPGEVDHLEIKRYEFTSGRDDDELVFFEISGVDHEGNPVDNACDRVRVEVNGHGRLIGLDNGDSTDSDGYRTDVKRLFGGKLLCMVRPDDNGDPDSISISAAIEKNGIPDVRCIRLKSDSSNILTPDMGDILVEYTVEPAAAASRGICFSVLDESGVPSKLADIDCAKDHNETSPAGRIRLTPRGDGRIRLRASSGSDHMKVRVISELDFEISGYGQIYADPYGFVYGSSYTSYSGQVSSGNEKGVATSREGTTVVTYANLDFGRIGSDRVTLPIFSLDEDRVPLKIWMGSHDDKDSLLLFDGVYDKPRIWNTYIEDSFTLSKRLKGINTVSFEFNKKVHLKGFTFEKQSAVGVAFPIGTADHISGDSFTRNGDLVEHIGNNVTIVFNDIDLGAPSHKSIHIKGRCVNSSNPIRIKFNNTEGEIVTTCEFTHSDEYGTQIFDLGFIGGMQDMNFIFLPGSNFDFESFEIGETAVEEAD